MIPWFQLTTVHLGFLTVQVWGSWVALGMLVAFYLMYRRARQQKISEEQLLDLAFWMIVGGIIGARLVHVLFYAPELYLARPFDIIKIWEGGMSSMGGMLGGLLVFFAYVLKKKFKRKQWLQFTDIFAFATLYGWIIGRIGCFFIHDHPGIRFNYFPAIAWPGGPRFDMALLEIIGLLPLAIYFARTQKKLRKAGWYTVVFALYYEGLRFLLDFLRARDVSEADTRYFGLTPAQYFGIVVAVVILVILLRKKAK